MDLPMQFGIHPRDDLGALFIISRFTPGSRDIFVQRVEASQEINRRDPPARDCQAHANHILRNRRVLARGQQPPIGVTPVALRESQVIIVGRTNPIDLIHIQRR